LQIFERENQTISIKELEIGKENFQHSLNTAGQVNFRKVDQDNYILEEDDFEYSTEKLDIKHKGIGDEEIDCFSKELKDIAKRVSVINSRIKSSLGQSPANYMKPSLDIISDKWSYFTSLVDDIKHNYLHDR
jgi:hypothetical protein